MKRKKRLKPPKLTRREILRLLKEGEKDAEELDKKLREAMAPTDENLSLVLR